MRRRGLIAGAAAVCIGLFVLIPVQQPHLNYSTGLATERDPTRSRLHTAILRLWHVEIAERLRWLGLLPTAENTPRPRLADPAEP